MSSTTSTPVASIAGPRIRAVLELAVLPTAAVALLAWWLVGPLEAANGTDQILALPWAEDNATLLGALGLVGATAVLADVGHRWSSLARRRALLAFALATLAGGVLGGALRLATSVSHGANIGGGMGIVLGPPIVLALLIPAAITAANAGELRTLQRAVRRTAPA